MFTKHIKNTIYTRRKCTMSNYNLKPNLDSALSSKQSFMQENARPDALCNNLDGGPMQ